MAQVHAVAGLGDREEHLLVETVGLFDLLEQQDPGDGIKEIIRQYTNNFKDIKGFMYSRDINDYEGSI